MSPTILCLAFMTLMLASVSSVKDPFSVIDATSFDVNVGCKKYHGMGDIHPGDHLGYKELNFSRDAIAFKMKTVHFNERFPNRQISLRLDSHTAVPFITYNDFYPTMDRFQGIIPTLLIPTNKRPHGVHDLYITFEGSDSSNAVAELFWFTFIASDDYCPGQTPSPTPCPTQPKPKPNPDPETIANCHTCSSDEIPSSNTIVSCNNKTKININIVVEDV